MSDLEIAKSYTDAVNKRNDMQDAQAKLVHDNLLSYDRFFDLSVTLTPEKARERLPKEAAIVDKIEAGSLAVSEARNAIWGVMNACLIEKMKIVSKQPVDRSRGEAQLMVDALQEVGQFRIEHLDGIDSKFDFVIEHGHGFQAKDKDRLINRLIVVWAKGYGIPIKELKPKVEEWARAAQAASEQRNDFTFR